MRSYEHYPSIQILKPRQNVLGQDNINMGEFIEKENDKNFENNE